MRGVGRTLRYLFDRDEGIADQQIARWLLLRAMGAIYFSVFFALLFQIRGLIGTQGILPAREYLQRLHAVGALRFWYAPTLLWWIGSGNHALMALSWVGLLASLLVMANVAPRASLVVCFLCFLSFIGVAQDFGQYQSDGMLLEAGFLLLFVAPPGLWPGWGQRSRLHPRALPVRAAVYLLLWEWFRIYFQSGAVKLLSGDATWRNLTAMYEYYQNGPLPTWMGWYLQHLPHWFQRATAGATLGMELALVWMAFLPRRLKVVCFCIVTAWQAVVIATANYAFLNYLVLVLAVLLLDDVVLLRFVPLRWRGGLVERPEKHQTARLRGWPGIRVAVTAVALLWVGYATAAEAVEMFWPEAPLPNGPVAALEPLRIANQYGLFAVMTPHRYEIEFQGSNDGVTWTPYLFRYKPQAVNERPGIYAPYQPRFDWNLWFASLTTWTEAPIIPLTEERLLEGDRDVLDLFRGDPFAGHPPKMVRVVLWQYWFSSREEKKATGAWWRRQMLGTYAPTVERLPNGQFGEIEAPTLNGPP
jgi:hypothetical protein